METDDTVMPTAPRAATLAELMPGRVLAERYRVDGVLGEGGMAVVFEGHHLGLDREIAIKVLKPEFVSAPQVLGRFEQEARAVSRLEHPGIVKMFDVGTAQLPGLVAPVAYLVMERLHGAELADVLREDGPLPAPQALEWIASLLEAIGHAHAREVVHRDLKPENIFVSETPEGRVLKLVDFGIAKMVQPSGAAPLTQMGMIFGTPSYMSPEQATGQPVDARTDLYSAGIILYELLSGHVPFEAADMVDVLRKQVTAPPPPLPVAPEVAEVLERLLGKMPQERYPDARTALEAVREAKRSLEAPPPTPAAPTMPRIEMEPAPAPDAPAPRRTQAPPLRTIGMAAAGALALGLVLWAAASDDEESEDDAAAEDGGADAADADSSTPQPVAGAPELPIQIPFTTPKATDDDLAPVDDALEAGKRNEARALLALLLERFPEDPDVLWRAGLAEGKPSKASEQRAAYMLQAIEADPARLKDGDVVALLLRELARKDVPEPFIELIAEHGGPLQAGWTKVLLGGPSNALPYAHRARLIEVAEPSDTWSRQAQRCLDLWQAPQTDRPCTVYAEALEAMQDDPSATYRRSLEHADVPTEPGEAEGAGACEGLQADRDALLESLEDAEGDGDFVPSDFASQAKDRRSGRRRRGPLRRIFGG